MHAKMAYPGIPFSTFRFKSRGRIASLAMVVIIAFILYPTDLISQLFEKDLDLHLPPSNSSSPEDNQTIDIQFEVEIRRILMWNTVFRDPGLFGIGGTQGEIQLSSQCEYNCEFTHDRALWNRSHALVFHSWDCDLLTETVIIEGENVTRPADVPPARDRKQFYVYVTREAPNRITSNEEPYRFFFNWTITHRIDSDFPSFYAIMQKKTPEETASYSLESHEELAKRPNLVAWLVSNNDTVKSGRSELVRELRKHIPVNIYGQAGDLKCNGEVHGDCYAELAMTHKFYLAFENALCRDYVTEKFFKALTTGMVPVVLGGANYGNQFPFGSFINVDSFSSAKALADYLLYLDAHDEEYLKYFQWRKYFKVVSDPYNEMFCRMCKRLHQDFGRTTSILDIVDWTLKSNSTYPVCIEPPFPFW